MMVRGVPSQGSRVSVGLWVPWHMGVVTQGVSGAWEEGTRPHVERTRLSKSVRSHYV